MCLWVFFVDFVLFLVVYLTFTKFYTYKSSICSYIDRKMTAFFEHFEVIKIDIKLRLSKFYFPSTWCKIILFSLNFDISLLKK